MKIVMVTPAPPGSHVGNRVTATRWATLLRSLGHRVAIRQEYHDEPCDVLVALHARRSSRSIVGYRKLRPSGPLIVALTGTDLYRDLARSKSAGHSLDLANRIVVLQEQALSSLEPKWRRKASVIYQSASPPPRKKPPLKRSFEIVVMGHLRPVKDPFRAAMAARRLPNSSQIRITHLGAALSPSMEMRAVREMQANRRYHWLGDQPRSKVWQYLLRSRALVVSSKMEGGANVIAESITAGVPVLCSRVPGNIGMLGNDYAAYFRYGDTKQLAQLLGRIETDRAFYHTLQAHCRGLQPRFHPEQERSGWRNLIHSVEGLGRD